MRLPFLLCTLILALAIVCGEAQSITPPRADEPPPKPNLVLAPGMSCRTKIRHLSLEKYMEINKGFNPGQVPSERIFSFSGKDSWVLTKFTNGQTEGTFIRGRYYLAQNSKTGVVIMPVNTPSTSASDFRGNYFPELAWLDKASYAGVIKIKSVSYHLFRGVASDGNEASLYLSMETLYPSFMSSLSKEYTYTYANDVPIGQKMNLPKELNDRWQLVRERSKKYLGEDIKDE